MLTSFIIFLCSVALIARVAADTLCSQNRFYCGHELEVAFDNVQHDSLYKCDANSHTATLYTKCEPNQCHNVQSADSHCQCKVGKQYCGYDLWMSNMLPTADDHTIYKCTKNGPTEVKKCPHGCTSKVEGVAICNVAHPKRLKEDTVLCGHELGPTHKHEGWHPQQIYRIGPTGSAVPTGSNCYAGCIKHLLDSAAHCDISGAAPTPKQPQRS